jgi:hypothetical protein
VNVDTSTESRKDTAGFFSSAKSFSLPLGPRIDPEGVAGYPIDMRVKARTPGWPPDWMLPRERQLHVDVIQWGLAAYERHLAGAGDEWLQSAIGCGEHFLEIQERGGDRDGAWLHLFRYPHSLPLPPPWTSAMAQGEGASLLVRLHQATGEEKYAEAATRALKPMRVPTEEGGCMALMDGRPFPEEYPTTPPSFVLNGGIFALWGLRDVGVGLGDEQAMREFHDGAETLARNLERWDTGRWSRYDLFPHPVLNPASSFYHDLHVKQLRAMAMFHPDPRFDALADRWQGFAESSFNSRLAFVQKGLYRIVVPRNAVFAHRLPWTRRLAA